MLLSELILYWGFGCVVPRNGQHLCQFEENFPKITAEALERELQNERNAQSAMCHVVPRAHRVN